MPNSEVESRLQFLSWIAAAAAVITGLVLVGSVTLMLLLTLNLQHSADAVRAESAQDHAALCGMKVNTIDQIKESRAYLKTHPDGLIVNGQVLISRAQIEQGIAREETFLKVLAPISC